MSFKIDEMSFLFSLKKLNLKTYINALKIYRQTFDNVLKLEDNTPIFLDTNILLRYYSISHNDRNALLAFLQKHQNNIVLTNQVQIEFIRNRESIIEKFFNETLSTLKSSFKTDIINKLNEYKNKNKLIMKDFSFLDGNLNEISNTLDSTYKQLEEAVENKKSDLLKTKYEDKLLDILDNVKCIDELSESEIRILKTEFDSLKKDFEQIKTNSDLKKVHRAFPGMGDIKEKSDPYGDYIIFHEIVKYMKLNDTNAVFLTYDSTKDDWFKENKEAHSHYIQSVYVITEKTLFFVEADRFFADNLKQHFTSMIRNTYPETFDNEDYFLDLKNEEIKNTFLSKCIVLESIMRSISNRLEYNKSGNITLRNVLAKLTEQALVDEIWTKEFYKIFNLRNSIIHSIDKDRLLNLTKNDYLEILFITDALTQIMNQVYSTL